MPAKPGVESFSIQDIATAAGVPVGQVERHVIAGGVTTANGWLEAPDAIRLLREIANGRPVYSASPSFFAVVKSRPPRSLGGLATSAGLHAVAATILIVASLSLLGASTHRAEPAAPVRLVYLMAPGPGGGGGGGGIKVPLPARRAARKTPEIKKVSSPVPEVKPPAPPPPPKVDPPPAPPPPPAPVQAPVVPKPADPVEAAGIPAPAPKPPADQGSGIGGGAGSGSGRGVGEGTGAGIGPGSDAGEGGGPYRPGAGIDPPRLLREVKATYTDEARRRGLTGEVLLEIGVGRNGSVQDVRVRRGLDRDLDQRAVEAVRQWRFAPAKRHGVPVDVIVQVAVEFKLR